jgi:hypothetical protein
MIQINTHSIEYRLLSLCQKLGAIAKDVIEVLDILLRRFVCVAVLQIKYNMPIEGWIYISLFFFFFHCNF